MLPSKFLRKLVKPKSAQSDLPRTEAEWVEYVNSLYTAGINERQKYEFQWTVNLAYYLGYQNLVFNPRLGAIEIDKNDSLSFTVNRIGSFIDSRHAKLTKGRPVARVIPNTSDQEDRKAAKYSDQALMDLWRKIGMEEKDDKLSMHMLIQGSSFLSTVWDGSAGEYILEDKIEGEVMELDDHGAPMKEKIFLGEVASSIRTAYQIIPSNFMNPEVKTQEWMMETIDVSVLQLEAMYPKLKGKLSQVSFDEKTEYERILERISSPLYTSTHEINPKNDEISGRARVKILWIKPNSAYEKGVVVVVIGPHCAHIGEWETSYGDNVYPIVKYHEKEDGIHFFPAATLERLIPIQRVLNEVRQSGRDNVKLMAKGKWLLPKGSQVEEDALTDEEGEVIEYNPAVEKPTQAIIAPLPNYFENFQDRLLVDFRDVGGQRESSVTPPPGVTAGAAMETLSELADEIIGPIVRRKARSLQYTAQQQLILMNENYTDPRRIKIFGSSGEIGVAFLKSADFRNHTDVHIEIESMIPEFRGTKRQTLFDLWDRRVITDPKQFLRALRFGYDLLLDEQDSVEDKVWIDIQSLKKGKMPPVLPFDNHLEYVKMLTKWMDTPEFMRLIPERKQASVAFVQQHLQFLMNQMPLGGAPMGQQNQNAVNTPFGPSVPQGTQGNGA